MRLFPMRAIEKREIIGGLQPCYPSTRVSSEIRSADTAWSLFLKKGNPYCMIPHHHKDWGSPDHHCLAAFLSCIIDHPLVLRAWLTDWAGVGKTTPCIFFSQTRAGAQLAPSVEVHSTISRLISEFAPGKGSTGVGALYLFLQSPIWHGYRQEEQELEMRATLPKARFLL